MFKKNKKGFALVETLIVSVFVATIFTIMYTNFFPMFGEYERREAYDDIDSIYNTYLLKRMFENPVFRSNNDTFYNSKKNSANTNGYQEIVSINYPELPENFDCSDENALDAIIETHTNTINNQINSACETITNPNNIFPSSNISTKNYCITLLKDIKVSKIYITPYTISTVKKKVKEGTATGINTNIQDYIDSIPYYKNNNSGCSYRIIVEFIKETNKESTCYKKRKYSFSTIGVNI